MKRFKNATGSIILIFHILLWLQLGCSPVSSTDTQNRTPAAPTPTQIQNNSSLTVQPTRTPEGVETQPAGLPPTPTPSTLQLELVLEGSLIFFQENRLLRWDNNSKQIETLSNAVNSNPVYLNRMALFIDKGSDNKRDSINYVNLDTGDRFKLIEAESSISTIQMSPAQRWLIYTQENPDVVNVREILNVDQQILLGDLQYKVELKNVRSFKWRTDNELTWSNNEGIWGLDLNASNSFQPTLLIEPSQNTYLSPSGESQNMRTIPIKWSPDGNFLIALEYAFEGGDYILLNTNQNSYIPIPGASLFYGLGGDRFIWLDESSFIHFGSNLEVWQMHDSTLDLEQSVDLPGAIVGSIQRLDGETVRFSTSAVSGTPFSALFEFDRLKSTVTQLSIDYRQLNFSDWEPVETLWIDEHQLAVVNFEIRDQEQSKTQLTARLDYLDGKESIEISDSLDRLTCCWYHLPQE